MFERFRKQPEKTNYGKIIAITLAVVGGICTVAYVLCRLFNKYFCIDCDDDELLCDDDDGCCEVCIEDEEDTDEGDAEPVQISTEDK